MKNLLKSIVLIIAILGTINTLAANTNPIKDIEEATLINESNVMFSLLNSDDSKSFNNVTYNGITKIVKIDAKENIAFIEIMNEKGELEFLMPVGTKILNIDLLDFEKGNYTVNIKMQAADNKIIQSSLVKAF